MILQWHRENQKMGFKMNMKVMLNDNILDHESQMNHEVIECVQKYIYLG